MSALSDPVSRMTACLDLHGECRALGCYGDRGICRELRNGVCGDSEGVAYESECHPWLTTSCKTEKTWFRHLVQTILDAPDTGQRWTRSSSKQMADLKSLAWCLSWFRGSSLKVVSTVSLPQPEPSRYVRSSIRRG